MQSQGLFISLDVQVSIWKKKSFGLYDLQCLPADRKDIRIFVTQEGMLLLEPDTSEYFFVKNYANNKFTRKLRKIELRIEQPFSPDGWHISSNSKNKLQHFNIWTVHEDKKTLKGFPLKSGQIFRFGRQVVEVHKIFLLGKSFEDDTPQNIIGGYDGAQNNDESLKNGNDVKCRICLDDESSDRPFAHNICKCQDSLSIHIDCLLHWTTKRAEKTSKNGVIFYKTSDISCEICKTPYPSKLPFRGKEVPILNIPRPKDTSYLWLHLYDLSKHQINSIAIIELKDSFVSEQVITVGRSDKNNLFLRDSSISRSHASFVWTKNELYLFDNGSKFGTLQSVPQRASVAQLSDKKIVIDKFMLRLKHIFVKNLNNVILGGEPVRTDPVSFDKRLFEQSLTPIEAESPEESPSASIIRANEEEAAAEAREERRDVIQADQPSPRPLTPILQTLNTFQESAVTPIMAVDPTIHPEERFNLDIIPGPVNGSFLDESNSQIILSHRQNPRGLIYEF